MIGSVMVRDVNSYQRRLDCIEVKTLRRLQHMPASPDAPDSRLGPDRTRPNFSIPSSNWVETSAWNLTTVIRAARPEHTAALLTRQLARPGTVARTETRTLHRIAKY